MRTRLEFIDGETNIFAKLATINLGVVKEGLQIEGSKIAKVYQQEIRATEKSEWSSVSRDKKRRLTLEEKKAEFGAKHSKSTGLPIPPTKRGESSIADHVKFFAPPELEKLYVVIAGGHKGFRPIAYKDGIQVGYFGKYQGATSQATLEILDGLNDGRTIKVTDKMRDFLNMTLGISGGGIKKSTKTLHIKPRHFAEKARVKGASMAIDSLTRRYNKHFPMAVANIKVREVKVKTS